MTKRTFFAVALSLIMGILAGASSAMANPFDDGFDEFFPNRPGPAQLVDLGERRADKFITNEHRFEVLQGQRRGVRAVVIEGTKRTVDIRRVEVVYRSGRVEVLHNLYGVIRAGERMRQRIEGGRVVQVIVHATSPNLFGSRGKYKTMLRIRRR